MGNLLNKHLVLQGKERKHALALLLPAGAPSGTRKKFQKFSYIIKKIQAYLPYHQFSHISAKEYLQSPHPQHHWNKKVKDYMKLD